MATKQVVGNAGQTATIAGRAAEFLTVNYVGAHVSGCALYHRRTKHG
jgi:hypothetical protein